MNLVPKPYNIQALHIAAALGDEKSMSILIEAGADKNALTIAAEGKFHLRSGDIILNDTPKAAIDLAPIKQVSFLLKKGAQPTNASLIRAIKEKDFELVKLMLEKEADPNQATGKSGSPLNLALGMSYKAIADLLIENGADISSVSWKHLDLPSRMESARANLYPKLTSAPEAHLSFPEFDSTPEIIKTHKLSGSPTQSFRSIQIPSRRSSNRDQKRVDPDQLTWTLIRSGAEQIIKPQEKLPNLKSGDILEITGFHRFTFNPNQNLNWKPINSFTESQIAATLREANRFSVKLSFEGKTRELKICPDLIAYDARGQEFPTDKLGPLLGLIWYDRLVSDSQIPRKIVVKREGFPDLVSAPSKGYPQFAALQLLPDDHIYVTEEPETDHEIAKLARRRSSITASLPQTLGLWRWPVIKNETNPPLPQHFWRSLPT